MSSGAGPTGRAPKKKRRRKKRASEPPAGPAQVAAAPRRSLLPWALLALGMLALGASTFLFALYPAEHGPGSGKAAEVTVAPHMAAEELAGALATAYLFEKQFAKALPLLDQSVAAEPGNFALHMMYGRGLRDSKKYDPAAQQFFQATKLQPDSREAWNEMAGMLYISEKFPESLAALDRAHQLGDDTPANYYFHAITYDKLRALQQALDYYRQFLDRSNGKFPDEEWKARQRAKLLDRELHRQ